MLLQMLLFDWLLYLLPYEKRNNTHLAISFQKLLKTVFLLNVSCSISDSTKTIRLLALDFYGRCIEISSSQSNC